MNPTAELLDCILKDEIETQPVAITKENPIASISAEDDVIDGAGIMDAGFTRHGERISKNIRKSSLNIPLEISREKI
jgi:hypothetical protein